MIGFNFLGKMGQLGNQMFQLASLKGIAKQNNYDFCIPNHNEVVVDYFGNKLRIQLFEPFILKNVKQINLQIIDESKPSIQESGFEFDENLFNNCSDFVNLVGYFQSEKYFKHIENEVREDFTFKDEILDPCKEMISSLKEPVSLHIRRGDFLANSVNHHNLDLRYYEQALNHIDTSLPVIIFSDDPEWCEEQDLFSDDRFLISKGNSSYIDLCLMTLCTRHIIANSTFSWWGAWLANSKQVIAPTKWFGPNNAHLITKDLYPDSWILI